ncbi:MAG: hypothetical protein ACLP51_08895 [Syntrophobacteraceae bacterium]
MVDTGRVEIVAPRCIVAINWLATGEGDLYGSPPEGESAEPASEYNLPDSGARCGNKRGDMGEPISMAWKVLSSENRQAAEALKKIFG